MDFNNLDYMIDMLVQHGVNPYFSLSQAFTQSCLDVNGKIIENSTYDGTVWMEVLYSIWMSVVMVVWTIKLVLNGPLFLFSLQDMESRNPFSMLDSMMFGVRNRMGNMHRNFVSHVVSSNTPHSPYKYNY
jgi:hypothetical protein